jgi:hypothetical protein
MKQLTLGDVLDFAADLRRKGMTLEEFRALPIYIGDDDELNGVHCGWYVEVVDANNDDENTQYVVEMINEDRGNFEITGKAILIS